MNQIVSRGHTRPLTEINFIPDNEGNTLLISSAHDKLPSVRNGESGNWIGTFNGHKGAVWSAKIDKKTQTLAATASGDFTAKLWCTQTGKEIYEFKHKHVVKSIDFSSDTERIASGCQDGLLRVYTTSRPELPPTEYKIAANSDCGITKIAWSNHDNNCVFAGKKSGVIELWDVRQPHGGNAASPTMSTLIGGGAAIMDLEMNDNNETILIATGNKVCLLSSKDLSIIKEFTMPSTLSFKEEGGASMHPDGSKFIAGGSDLWLREFDYNSGEVLQTFKGHHGPIRCVRYHPSGSVGASGSEDATIRLWSLTGNDEASS